MIGSEPICMKYKHLIKNKLGEWGFRCDVFLGGIPEEIITGEVDHTKPYDGDGGIQYAAEE